jgi:hypothetical protein
MHILVFKWTYVGRVRLILPLLFCDVVLLGFRHVRCNETRIILRHVNGRILHIRDDEVVWPSARFWHDLGVINVSNVNMQGRQVPYRAGE